MDNRQIEAFYKELGQVCQKYKIGAFVGWWFDGKDGDDFGTCRCWDITDEQMKMLSIFMETQIENWNRQIKPPDVKGEFKHVITGKPQGN